MSQKRPFISPLCFSYCLFLSVLDTDLAHFCCSRHCLTNICHWRSYCYRCSSLGADRSRHTCGCVRCKLLIYWIYATLLPEATNWCKHATKCSKVLLQAYLFQVELHRSHLRSTCSLGSSPSLSTAGSCNKTKLILINLYLLSKLPFYATSLLDVLWDIDA